jgi:Tfp pilus assembly protein PilO
MQQHRIISLASILAMLLIPVLAWFLVAQPQLAAAADADQQRQDMESQIAAAAATVAQLKADSAKLPELNDDLNDLRTSIPADADTDGYIDGLAALAKAAHLQVVGLTVAEPIAYTPAVAPPDPNAPAPDANASSASPSPSDAAAVTPAPTLDVPGIVTSPLIDSSNFVAIPVTVSVSGDLSQIIRFIDGLQSSPRLFLVTSTSTEQSATDHSTLTGKVTGFIWAIPTGVEGKPRPVSTQVKIMGPKTPDSTDGTDGTGTGTPDPNSTETPDPNATDNP